MNIMLNQLKGSSSHKGFTLLEILLILAALALLAAIVILALDPGSIFERLRDSERSKDLRNYHEALVLDPTGELKNRLSTDFQEICDDKGNARFNNNTCIDVRGSRGALSTGSIEKDPSLGSNSPGTGYYVRRNPDTRETEFYAPLAEDREVYVNINSTDVNDASILFNAEGIPYVNEDDPEANLNDLALGVRDEVTLFREDTKLTDWSYTMHSGFGWRDTLAVAIDQANNVFVGGESDKLVKLTQNGDYEWDADFGNDINDIAVDDEGYVYAVSTDSSARKFDPENGNQLWRFDDYPQDNEIRAVAVDSENNVYIGGRGGTVLKLNGENGQEIWDIQERSNTIYSIETTKDYVYYGDHMGELRKLNQDDGSVVWERNVSGRLHGLALTENHVYTGSWGNGTIWNPPIEDDEVNKLSKDTGDVLETQALNDKINDLVIDPVTEDVYVAEMNGVLSRLDSQTLDIIWQEDEFSRLRALDRFSY